MARDYANRGGNRGDGRNQARSRGKSGSAGSGLPGWIWLIAGLSVGLAVAAFVYIQRPAGDELPNNARVRGTPVEAPPARSSKVQTVPLPPKEKDRFTFYEILRNQEVIVPREAVRDAKPPKTPAGTAQPSTAPAAPSESYVIQTASFRSQPDAERHKASLALLGVESRIESVTIDNRDTFYRVRIGPINDVKRVQETMARLEKNDIQGMVVKLR